MQRIGCHVSIAGGVQNAPARAKELGCEVFQMFSRSPQGGPAPKLTPEIVSSFKAEMKANEQYECYIHAPYYINFASSKKEIRSASARVIREELERGSLVGAKYIMFHPGSAKDMAREEALKITAEGIAKVMDGYKGATELLLEISAGAGNVMGDTFEELGSIIKMSGYPDLGICLDTAHIFASGYDIKTDEGFKKVISIIKKTVGLKKIKLIHANDSMIELGGRKDRHDHIGHGKIGESGFVNLMSVFPDIDLICETEHDLVEKDIAKLKKIRHNLNHDK
ncbi:MAG: deoxyribonuclease IV [Candidatus Paceibacterota bacterium]